jgi:hypothetical protein
MNGPLFQTQHPNEDVTLHAGTLRLTGEANSIEGTGVGQAHLVADAAHRV